jgi:hypothetical protein
MGLMMPFRQRNLVPYFTLWKRPWPETGGMKAEHYQVLRTTTSAATLTLCTAPSTLQTASIETHLPYQKRTASEVRLCRHARIIQPLG